MTTLTTQIGELKVERGQVNSSLAADSATASAFESELRSINPIVHGEILQKDVIYQQLQAEFAKDVADLISERASFRDSFPGLAALSKRVNRERFQLRSFEALAIANGAGLSPSFTQTTLDGERAVGQVKADRERLNSIDAQLIGEEDHLRRVAGAGAMVATLRAERDAALQQYVTLAERMSGAQGDAAQGASLGSLVVISRAVPGPSSIYLWILLLAALIIVVAIGASFVVDAVNPRFWGVREIESVYGRPVLTEIGGRR